MPPAKKPVNTQANRLRQTTKALLHDTLQEVATGRGKKKTWVCYNIYKSNEQHRNKQHNRNIDKELFANMFNHPRPQKNLGF